MYPTEPQPQHGAAPSAAPYSGPPMSGPPAGAPDPNAGYGAAPQAYQQPAVLAAPAARPGNRKLTIGDVLSGVGGFVIFVCSFFPFVAYDEDFIRLLKEDSPRDFPEWFSAWSLQTFMGPLSWWAVLAGMVLIVLAALRFALPRDFEAVGFRINHLQVGLSLFAFFVLFGYALSAKYAFFSEEITTEVTDAMRQITSVDAELSLGAGGYLMLVGAIVAVTGAVLNQLDIGPTLWPTPPKPVGYQPGAVYGQPAAGYPQQQAYGAPQGYGAQPGFLPDPAAAYHQPQPPAQSYDPANQTSAQPVYDPAAYQQPPVEFQQPQDHTPPPQAPGQQPG